MEPNNARQLVEIAARDIEKLLSNRSKALVVSSACAFSLGHSPLTMCYLRFLLGWSILFGLLFSPCSRVQLMSSWNQCEYQANR